MLNYRLGTCTVNEKHWGFKPVFRCRKPHTFSTFSGEENDQKCRFTLFNKATKELNKTKSQKWFVVKVCNVLLFFTSRAVLSVCLYGPLCRGALKLDLSTLFTKYFL